MFRLFTKRFICSTIPESLDVGDRLYFSKSSKVSELRAGTMVQGGITHSTSIRLSIPYRDPDGSIKGEIVLIGDLERLAQGLRAYQWRPDHRLIILDDPGSLVLTLPTKGSEEADTIAKLIFPQISNATTGAIVVKDSIGRNLIVGVARPGSASEDLFTAVVLDRDSAFAETAIINVRSIAFNFFFLILAVIGVWLAAYLMIDRPVRRIIKSARKWESGDTKAAFRNSGIRTNLDS